MYTCVPAAISPGIMQSGCKYNHSAKPGVKVKNGWSCNSTPSYAYVMLTNKMHFLN